MARKKKTDKENIQDFNKDLDDFLSSAGVDVKTLSEHEQVPFWTHSGSYALNWIISDDMFKGVPSTKCILISGEEAKGKSLLSDVWLGENIKDGGTSFKMDIEDATGGSFTSKIIGDEEIAAKIRLISPSTSKAIKKADGDIKKLKQKELVITIEKMTSIINKLIDWQLSKGADKLPSIYIVIDSVSNLTSDKEIEDIAADKDKKDMTPQQKMRAFFRAVNQKLKEANITVIGIAHLTANIGVMFGPSKVISAKGTGFKYASSLTINMMSSKEIKDPKTEVAVGIRMKLQTTKNRMAYKGRYTFLSMYFNKGIDPYGGISELLTQYGLAKSSAKAKMDGSYNDTTKFTYVTEDGKELKWKYTELWKMMNSFKEEQRKSLLNEWNERLNEKYQEALNSMGITEETLLEDDDPITEEEDG